MISTINSCRCGSQNGRQREYGQDADDRSNAGTEQQDHEHEQTQSRNGPSGVADANHQKRAVTGVTDEDTERNGDDGGNCHRGGGIEEMLQEQVPDTGWAYSISRISQIGEQVHAVRRFLNQGSVPR